MKTVKNIFASITFQIAVNVIGLPEYHTLKTSRIVKTITFANSKFF